VDWDNIAPMVIMVVLTLTIGGVTLLRPISKRLAELLEVYARDKGSGVERELRQTRELIETMDARLRLMEERQDFTEKLLAGEAERSQDRIPSRTRDQRDPEA
jgi:hypothetical protein